MSAMSTSRLILGEFKSVKALCYMNVIEDWLSFDEIFFTNYMKGMSISTESHIFTLPYRHNRP